MIYLLIFYLFIFNEFSACRVLLRSSLTYVGVHSSELLWHYCVRFIHIGCGVLRCVALRCPAAPHHNGSGVNEP